jgi:hypothetical protein
MRNIFKISIALIVLTALTFGFNHYYTSLLKKNSRSAVNSEMRKSEHPAYDLYLKNMEIRKNRKNSNKEQRAKEMIEFLTQLRANQNTGVLDLNDVFAVRKQIDIIMNGSQNSRSRAAVNLQWEEMGPDNVGGRCRSIMIDKDNPLKMLAGSVSGGLFQSNNGGLSWEPHPFNFQPNYTGVAAVKQASNGVIYLATGESFGYSYQGYGTPPFSAPSVIGNGIFKSTDGGLTFTQISSTVPAPNNQNEAWAVISELAVDPNNPNRIFAATQKGLKVSDNGGDTWNDVTGLLTSDLNREAWDVEVGTDGLVHACINNKYYRSFNGLVFQNQMGVNNFPTSSGVGRIELALSPSDPNYLYALIATTGGATNGVYKSTDGGESWELMIAGDASTFNPLGGQGSWNNTIAVDPSDKDRIFLAGQLEVWSYAPNQGWNIIAFWQSDAPSNPYYVHADNHEIVFRQNDPNVMYVGNDGGIYQTSNAQNRFPTFLMRNKGFNATQFYGMGASLAGEVIGGSQDNGTQYINLKGNTSKSAREVKGGDGGPCEISRINPLAMFATSYSGNLERSSNGGASFGCFFDDRIDGSSNCNAGSVNFFLTRFALWEKSEDSSITYPDDVVVNGNVTVTTKTRRVKKVDKSILLVSAGGNIWVCPDALNFSDQARFFPIPTSAAPYAIATADDGTVYIGNTNSQVYRIDGLAKKYRLDNIRVEESFDTVVNGALTEVTHAIDTIYKIVPDYPLNSNTTNWNWPNVDDYKGLTRKLIGNNTDFGGGRWVSGIGIDPNDKERIVVTLSQYGNNNYVFIATDAASNNNPVFTNIQNNLPKFPVFGAVIDYYNPNNIILGTDVGVWTSTDGGASWDVDPNFPHVPVFHIRQDRLYRDECRVIYVGTHGRGIFRAFSPDFSGSCEKTPGLVSVGKNPVITDLLTAEFYPNPVRDKAVLELKTSKETNLNITMIDLLGRTYSVANRNQKLAKGKTAINFDFTSIPSGNYIMSVKTKEKSITKNIVVIK